ncbi:MAG: hypothetical protein ABI837_05970 [Acidobacteriota bacterium]
MRKHTALPMTNTNPVTRRLIGKNARITTRERIYETDEAVEVEMRDQYDVSRKRVLFDEVLLVTYHRTLGLSFLFVCAVGAVVFFGLGLFLLSSQQPVAAWVCSGVAVPFLLAGALRMILKLDFVTVFGRRSKAVMRFPFRKKRAHELYGHLCARTRTVQQRNARHTEEAPVGPAQAADDLPQPAVEPGLSAPPGPPGE